MLQLGLGCAKEISCFETALVFCCDVLLVLPESFLVWAHISPHVTHIPREAVLSWVQVHSRWQCAFRRAADTFKCLNKICLLFKAYTREPEGSFISYGVATRG